MVRPNLQQQASLPFSGYAARAVSFNVKDSLVQVNYCGWGPENDEILPIRSDRCGAKAHMASSVPERHRGSRLQAVLDRHHAGLQMKKVARRFGSAFLVQQAPSCGSAVGLSQWANW